MPETQVNVPGIGKVDRKWMFAGMAAVAGIVVYAYWRSSQMAPGEEPPGEGDQWVTGDDWSPDAYVGATAPGGANFDPGDVEDQTPITNAEWAQRVVDLLEGVGYDRNKAAATVGKYLSGQPLDTDERLIIQTAIALLGNPPAGALPLIPATGTPPTTTPPPATATKLTRPTIAMKTGLKTNTIYWLYCNKITGAVGYQWKRVSGPGAGLSIVTPGPSRMTPPLSRGKTYGYQVKALAAPGSGKTHSDWSNTVTIRVPTR